MNGREQPTAAAYYEATAREKMNGWAAAVPECRQVALGRCVLADSLEGPLEEWELGCRGTRDGDQAPQTTRFRLLHRASLPV